MAKHIDKQELATTIRNLQGVSDEQKSALLELLNEKKQYGLVWENHTEDVEEILREQLPVLTEVSERRILSEDKDAPNHILIEGDNLHALTSLCYTHEGKIDVIYIDPPYNTGNKDFVYNDSFVDTEDGYRHSKWLSFMEKRLRIAQKLLSDSGVIFISIDDNEQANLKLLCDEVFGESNFCAVYNWKRTETPPALSYKVRKKFEYILCYQKTDIPQRKFFQGFTDGGDAPLLNNGNPIGILTFPKGTVHFNITDGIYEASSNKVIKLLDKVVVEEGVNKFDFRAEGHYKWQQSNLENEVSQGTFFLIKGQTFSIRYQKSSKAIKVPSNIIDGDVEVGTNEEATKDMENLGLNFDYAKPVSLIKYLIKMPYPDSNDYTVLDFFAGSGTALHATMQLNAEDDGQRQCILVTNNENNICEEVTYERNKRVINGYTTPRGVEVEGLHNNNLRYYKTDFVPRDKTNTNKRRLVYAATDLLCIKENLYNEEKLVVGGKNVKKNFARRFVDGDKEMLVIYEPRLIAYVVEELKFREVAEPIKVYVFCEGQYAYNDDFKEVLDKVNLCALPEAIYQAYKKVLPKRKSPKEIAVQASEEDIAEAMNEANTYSYKSEEGGLS